VAAYENVASLPKRPDLVVVCTEQDETPGIVEECGENKVPGVILLSTGGRVTDEEIHGLEEQVRMIAQRYPRMRILGPNSYGLIVPHLNLNVSIAESIPRAGHLAFISQSKSLTASTLDWALKEQVGFSYFVSLGNAVDVSFSDLIDFFAGDPQTRALVLYLISIKDVRNFMSAARAFARNKPIVAYRSGRRAPSANSFASHTGVMACEDSVYSAAFERAGIVRVRKIEDIFDCAELLARQRTPRGERLGIIANANEPGLVAGDALVARHGCLATFTESTQRQVGPLLAPSCACHNAGILSIDGKSEQYAEAIQLAIKDRNIDAALVIFAPVADADPVVAAQALVEAAAESRVPVLAAWMGGQSVQPGIDILNSAGIPVYGTPEQAVRAFMYLVSYARNKEILYDTPRDVPVSFAPDRACFREFMREHQGEPLLESESKRLLQSYDIPTTEPAVAHTADEAVRIARHVGFPVVLKVHSRQITHKTDVQGVAVNLTTEAGVRSHFERIVTSAGRHRPEAHVDGVTVQRMIDAPFGIEMILGTKKDPTFGTVIMAGMGGTATEVIQDRAIGLPPLNERLARRMLESLRSWPLLLGYRGKPRVNLEGLIEIMMRLSYLAAEYPEIKELDINPLMVTPDKVIALDARIQVDEAIEAHTDRPYSHLAIRPYPEEYVGGGTLKDGTPVVLRPIKPEDEPRWQELLTECSDESIRSRFRSLFERSSHDLATRYCFVDYDREMSVVAEVQDEANSRIIGVGNLFSDTCRESAEFAVLVGDRWQGRGLGDLLTDHCIHIAQDWGVRRVRAETSNGNSRMLSVFTKRGFELSRDYVEDVVLVDKSLC
jgi:acetyltransferase